MIFVHGLGGHAIRTWRSILGDCWPTWLTQDIAALAVGTISYDASATGWTGHSMSLDERAKTLFPLLRDACSADGEPLVLVCHSLGGLVVKQIVVMAASNLHFGDDGKKFIARLAGVAFYATPHGGSSYGDVAAWLRFIVWPTPTIAYLTRGGAEVSRLNEEYRNLTNTFSVRHLVVYETKPTLFGQIVKRRDADPGIAGAEIQASDGNHFTVCRPRDQNDQRYTFVRDLVLKVIRDNIPDFLPAPTPVNRSIVADPLPIIPRGEPVIISHVILRFLVVLSVLFVAYRGVLSIYRDPFLLQVQARLEEIGVPRDRQQEISVRIVGALESRDIGREARPGLLREVGRKGSVDLEKLYNDFLELTEKYVALEKENERLRNSRDAEVRSFSDRATQILATGDVASAEVLTQAAALKRKILNEIAYAQKGGEIVFTNGWDRRNIVAVAVPQLAGIPLAGDSTQASLTQVRFYKGGAAQLRAAFADVSAAGLLPQIRQWCGSYSPRMVAGTNTPSAHALGIAFDINCGSLRVGQKVDLATNPALARLVEIFQKNGFIWGGNFTRPDPMHFQLFRADESDAG